MRSVSYYGLLERGIEKSVERSILAVKEDDPVVARSIFEVLSIQKPEVLIDIWKERELNLRNELWLDLYQALTDSPNEEARKVARPMPPVTQAEFMPLVYREEIPVLGS